MEDSGSGAVLLLLLVAFFVYRYLTREKRAVKESQYLLQKRIFADNASQVLLDRPKPILIDPVHHVYVTPSSKLDIRISGLHKQATIFKGSHEWEKAISCLVEASTLSANSKISYNATHYLRLPLFLQQAGHFAEAMREFQIILDSTKSRIDTQYSHQKEPVRTMLAHVEFARIYKSMCTACKREKRMEQAEEYLKKSEKHKYIHASMLKVDDARIAKELEKLKKDAWQG